MLSGLIAAHPASAVVIEGRSSTGLLWYNDIVDASKQMEAVESLRASISGIDSGEKLSLMGYGKLSYDVKHGGDVENRLYYFYADYKGLMDTADVKLGRQFVNLSAGSALIDGVEADINRIGPVGVVLWAANVLFGGRNWRAISTIRGKPTWWARRAHLDAGYFRTYDYSDVARDIVASSHKQYFFDWSRRMRMRGMILQRNLQCLLAGSNISPRST
jgi:hypothetical protein